MTNIDNTWYQRVFNVNIKNSPTSIGGGMN